MTWEDSWHHRFAPTNRGCCIAIPSTSHGLDLDQERLPWFNRGAFVVL